MLVQLRHNSGKPAERPACVAVCIDIDKHSLSWRVPNNPKAVGQHVTYNAAADSGGPLHSAAQTFHHRALAGVEIPHNRLPVKERRLLLPLSERGRAFGPGQVSVLLETKSGTAQCVLTEIIVLDLPSVPQQCAVEAEHRAPCRRGAAHGDGSQAWENTLPDGRNPI